MLEVRTGVANSTRGAGGGRLQANELAAAIQDEVASGENGLMTPRAAPRSCPVSPYATATAAADRNRLLRRV